MYLKRIYFGNRHPTIEIRRKKGLHDGSPEIVMRCSGDGQRAEAARISEEVCNQPGYSAPEQAEEDNDANPDLAAEVVVNFLGHFRFHFEFSRQRHYRSYLE